MHFGMFRSTVIGGLALLEEYFRLPYAAAKSDFIRYAVGLLAS